MTTARTAKEARQAGPRLLGIYLNDHFAGATLSTELARRVTRGQEADRALQSLASQIAQDRATLRDIMAALGVQVRAYKAGAAWLGEKAGRLKLNGQLLTRSPLSGLEELEILRLGGGGQDRVLANARSLAETESRLDPAQLDELLSRARRQVDFLEESRPRAAEKVFRLDRDAGHT